MFIIYLIIAVLLLIFAFACALAIIGIGAGLVQIAIEILAAGVEFIFKTFDFIILFPIRLFNITKIIFRHFYNLEVRRRNETEIRYRKYREKRESRQKEKRV